MDGRLVDGSIGSDRTPRRLRTETQGDRTQRQIARRNSMCKPPVQELPLQALPLQALRAKVLSKKFAGRSFDQQVRINKAIVIKKVGIKTTSCSGLAKMATDTLLEDTIQLDIKKQG